MKLYATITSERASKGQGGNKYLDVIIKDDNKEDIIRLSIIPFKDDVGDGITATIWWAEHIYINGEHGLDAEITTKSKSQKGEDYKCGCEFGYSDPLCDKKHNFKI